MGTTLTGTTPQDTYDSLIKVTDNGPLSGTAKYLSDGLGNDSVLALSNARVGIGTNTPQAPLEVKGSLGIRVDEAGTGSNVLTLRSDFAGAGPAVNVTSNSPLLFLTNNTERMRITSAGNVGIGTSSPAQRLDISNGAIKFDRITTGALTCNDAQGLIYSLNNNIGSIDGLRYAARTHRFVSHADSLYATIDVDGLKFGSDTAAANALDDYEEGTWTPALTASTAPTGVTYSFLGGRYTKIGRAVHVNFGFYVTSVGTGGSGSVFISGLPFQGLNSGGYQEPATRIFGSEWVTASYASSVYGFVENSGTTLQLRVGQNVDSTVAWSQVQVGTFLNANFTYFV